MKYIFFSIVQCVFFLSGFVNCGINHNVLNLLQILHISSVHPFVLDSQKLTNSSRNIYLNDIKKQNFSNLLTANHMQCWKDVLYTLENLDSEWAMKMLDSNGKLPSGVLLGNLLWIGKYSECSKVNVSGINGTSRFNGMYCMAQWNISLPSKIHLPTHEVPIKTGICLPSSCQSIDVKNDISHAINAVYLLPIMKQYEGILKLTTLDCKYKESYLTLPIILFLSFLGLYLFLHVAGSFLTITEYFLENITIITPSVKPLTNVTSDCVFLTSEDSFNHFEREECEDDQIDDMDNNNSVTIAATRKNYLRMAIILDKVRKPLKLFCIFKNAHQVLNVNSSRRQFPCLHGLRFFSMAWVILGHTYVHNVNYIDNYMDLLKGIDSLPFQIVIQGTFSVDTFFLIGGFLLGYLYLEEADKRNGKINWFGLCLHRFLRITPVYLFAIGFSSLIFKYLGSGPFWKDADDVATCQQYWWWNVLYINNFLPINSMCLTWTWYLANDMQFFIISSLILYVLWRWKYVGIGIFCSFLVSSWIITWYLSAVYDIPPLFMGITDVKNYTEYQGKLILGWDLLYSKPYCRVGPHIIGILLAYLVYYNANRKIVMTKGILIFGWCFAIFCSCIVIFGLYHVTPSSSLLNAYNAFGRTAFSIGVGWLIFCCLTGYAGFINEFLSFKLWIPLSRLTYCAYLFHPLVMNWYFQLREVPLFFTHVTMVIHYLSFMVISYGVAFIISITFEAPLINLEKLVYKKK